MVPYPSWLNAGDNAWQLTAATLVGLMSIPALAVLYGGLVQKKWIMNTMMMVFTTFCLGNFQLEYGDDVELCYAAATAHNRMMTDFCSVDRRLLATGYVPLMDFERAAAATKQAIALNFASTNKQSQKSA